MKTAILAVTMATLALGGAPQVLAQTATPAVTMAPVANPPEPTAKHHSGKNHKHHAKAHKAATPAAAGKS